MTPRKRSYGLEVEQVILLVWESLDYMCAERLTPVLLATAQHLARFGSVHVSSEVERQLAQISEATVTRLLRKHRSRKQRLPHKGPERANQVRKDVPMKRIAWDTPEPGHVEVDLVHHGGESTAGEYGHTIQLIDVATGWSERVAVLGRGQAAMESGFRRILERIPFALLELHPDNGSEFFNRHLVRFWKDKVTGVQFSRSRPYHKNDNRFVEQKNSSLVRQYVGTLRLDTPEQVAAMNGLYEQMWLYYNLFQPVLHLKEKRVEPDGIVRTWDVAQTPYQRLMASGRLSHEQQVRLQALYEQMWLYYNLFQPVLHLIEKQVHPDGIVRKWDRAQTPYQRLLASGKLSAQQHARLQALYEQTNPLQLRDEIYQGLAALLDCHAACNQGAA